MRQETHELCGELWGGKGMAPQLVPVTNREFCLHPIEDKAPGLPTRIHGAEAGI